MRLDVGPTPLSQSLSDAPSGYPRAVERDYARRLRGYVRRLHAWTVRRIREWLRAQGYRADVDAPLMPQGLVGLVAMLAADWQRQVLEEGIARLIEGTADRVARAALRSLQSSLGTRIAPMFPTVAAFGSAQESVIRSWVEGNAVLVGLTGDPNSIPNRYFTQVAELVRVAQESGQTIDTLAGILSDRYQVTLSRANLIARTEVAKLNSGITRAQQTDVGITSYVWETSRDERVRESHRANQGQVFDWQNPPATGHPGQDFQCRCVARPVLPDWAGGSPQSVTRSELTRFRRPHPLARPSTTESEM